jgi:hypothetical protein
MAQVGEDAQGLLPALASSAGVTRCVAGLAEAAEGAGFLIAISEVAEKAEGFLVEAEGARIVAKAVVDVAEAVEGGGLAETVTEVAEEVEGLLAVSEGVLVIAEDGAVPADGVEGVGLHGPVAFGLRYLQGPPGMIARLAVAVLPPEQVSEAEVHDGLAGPVAKLPVQVQGTLEMGVGVRVGAEHPVRVTEFSAGASLRGGVVEALGRRQCRVLGGDVCPPVPAAGEEVRQCPGKLPGVGVEAGFGGQCDGREHDGVLGLQPGQRLGVVSEGFGRRFRLARGQGDRVAGGGKEPGRAAGGVQVMVQHPAQGDTAIGVAVEGRWLLSGVGA